MRTVLLAEDAIAYDRAFSDRREFRRKVRTLAGNYQVLALMPQLLDPIANPSWFETVSHKLLRLVCPWALVGLFLASLAAALDPTAPPTSQAVMQALVLAQLAFYLAALVGPIAGRVAGVARTFVLMHVAAVVGLYRFLTGRQPVTW